MLAWVLELLIGTGLVLLVRKKLPELIQKLEREPLTTTQLPASDVPDVLQGGAAGGAAFALAIVIINLNGGPLSTLAGFGALCSLPVLGALVQQRFTGMYTLAVGHPWRTLVEELAQKAGIGEVQVILVQRHDPQITIRGRTLYLPTRTVRRFSTEELRFLVGLALWEIRGGQSQSDLGDQFALTLTGDLRAAQTALQGLQYRKDSWHLLSTEQLEQRIERLSSWWQRQHRPNTPAASAAQVQQVQRVGRP